MGNDPNLKENVDVVHIVQVLVEFLADCPIGMVFSLFLMTCCKVVRKLGILEIRGGREESCL